jgi:asparagine synthase (glutamine-hydrolysing)
MCGIVGYAASGDSAEILGTRLLQANDLMHHRGPDDGGCYADGRVGLAARRLSIIDLAGGHQPLANEDETIWITYNGEVFNAPELRDELLASGHRFRTQTDTEVVVHAYEEWGDDFVARMRGIFAFGLWDGRRERLLLARDHFGIKPLYYSQQSDALIFGSEIRPILSLADITPAANYQALYQLFSYGFIGTPQTAFQEIYKVPAAHLLLYEKGEVTVRPYWQLSFPEDGRYLPLSAEEAAEQFYSRLQETVDAWRMSDVPVGSLLSGGIDSSTLAMLLTGLHGRPIHTFTIAFSAASHDESPNARQVAEHIGSEHHELIFTAADFDYLPEVVGRLEEPQCSATSVPIYLLYRACHEAGFKVIMTGEGADELLGGYHWFDGDRRVQSLLGLPRPLRTILSRLPIPASNAARRVLAHGTADPTQRYPLWHQLTTPTQLATLFNQPIALNNSQFIIHNSLFPLPNYPITQLPNYPITNYQLHPLNQFITLESQTRMVDFINFEVDRMSMASSVEARPPFLDYRLWEFCAQLPPELKLRPGQNKFLLREAMANRLPEGTRRRPKKGLATPHSAWWRGEELPGWAEEAIHPTALAESGYFNIDMVARLRRQHQEGRVDNGRLLTGILTTQLWHDQFLR